MDSGSAAALDEDQTQYTRSAAKWASPYPGLRPFTEDESSFFFGRQAQVNQIIAHLKTTQVVFVLGGSGSGKSSLIRAGVISELRGYAIKEAGDHWVPVVVTPGTNLADTKNSHLPARTPLFRLAGRLANCAYLKAQDKEDSVAEQVRERAQNIETLLRNPGGFRLVYDRYFQRSAPHEVTLSPNLLIVLDQFEEIFHPSNVGVPDCQMLVERIMEHFDACHPRVFIVITMRSEHLNDCATFLRLPDIINRTSFLVRRLEPSELQESIVKPGQRKLRILQREARAKKLNLPNSFSFDLHLLQLILEDIEQIKSDPDHLPLLQHLLARLYEAATVRAKTAGFDFPAQITLEDLKAVLNPGHKPDEFSPQAGNMLRLCLEANAEHVFASLASTDAEKIEKILCHLAFKDPNSGLYTQQRLTVQDAMALTETDSVDRVSRLLSPFLSPLDYLYWDNATPGIITIKVSHESFIRGWNRFRRLIDTEHGVFEDYMHLAKDYQLWKEEGKSNYLSALRIKALERKGIAKRILLDYDRRYLSLLVKIKRERPKYALDYDDISQYIKDSRHHVMEGKRRRARIEKTMLFLSLGLVVFVGYVMYDTYFVKPEKMRMVDLFETFPLVRVSQRINQSNYIDLERQQISIGNLASASETLKSECDMSRKNCQSYFSIGQNASKITTWVESDINSEARTLLSKGMLAKNYVKGNQANSAVAWRSNASVTSCNAGGGLNVSGKLLQGKQAKNIFIDTSNPTLLSLHVANFSDGEGCSYANAEPITTLPINNPPAIFISRDLNHLVVATQDPRNATRSNASLNDLNWTFSQGHWRAFSRERIVVGNSYTRYAPDTSQMYGLYVLGRTDELGSHRVDFGGLSITMLDSDSSVPESYVAAKYWYELKSDSCLSREGKAPETSMVFAASNADFCFHIAKPADGASMRASETGVNGVTLPMRDYIVSVYRFSLQTGEMPVAVAQFPLRSFEDQSRVQWLIGRNRDTSGWITSRLEGTWAGAAPWRTETLIGMLKPQREAASSMAAHIEAGGK